MPFNRPTLPELLDRNRADIESVLPPGDAHLRRHKLGMLAKVNAGAAHGMHGHLAWLADQILPDRAEWEMLIRWGSLRDVLPLPAYGASGTILVTGQPGALLRSGEALTRADGWEYLTTQIVNLNAQGKATVPVVSTQAGYDGNAVKSVVLRFARSIPGIAPQATVDAIGGGADAEAIASYRERVVFRWRNPPQQGALHDYVAWAREANPAVTRAWAYRNEMGANTVTVRFVTDQAPTGPIPDKVLIKLVYAHIRAKMPATPELFVVEPLTKAVPVTLSILPDTPAMRSAATLEIRDFFISDPDLEPGGTVYRSRLSEAVSKTPGERAHSLLAPSGDINLETGELPVLGNLSWSAP
ncbi:baseplate J/gp47 family protein [Aeromonas veronii]|uniref:baseplate J/gp47 family protein n=1 Tax=Aeromonas veronii TaxID=654 RepID=UPI003D23798C